MKKIAVISTMLLLLLSFYGQSIAGIRIEISIPVPPVFVFPAPLVVVVIPETYVYYHPDADFDIFFYGGHWNRPYEGCWYRSANYGGPWGYIGRAPSVLLSLPPNYRIIAREGRRIPYGELNRNWHIWETGRYWEHHNWGRPGLNRHHGYGRSHGRAKVLDDDDDD